MEAMEKLRSNSFRENSISSAPPSMALYLELIPGTDSDGGSAAPGGPSGDGGPPRRQGSVYPTLPSVAPRTCPLHELPLELYCRDCQECVCAECRHDRRGHRNHHVLRPEDERTERRKELAQMQVDLQKRIQDTEKHLRELPHLARQHKASIQAVQTESSAVFSALVGSVETMAAQVAQLLCAHEASLPSRAEVHIQGLEQEVAMLRWRRRNCEEIARLAEMEDPVCFLKNFLTMEPLAVQTGGQGGLAQEERVVAEVHSAVTQLRDHLQDLCKTSLDNIFRIVNDSRMTPLASDVEDIQPTTTNAGVTSVDEKQTNPRQDTVYDMTTNPTPRPPLRPQASCPLPSRATGGAMPSTQSAATTRPKGGALSCTPPPSHRRASATPPPLPPPRVEASPVQTTAVNPEPQTREDMLKYHFEPTMDPDTAYRNVLVSDGGWKATLKAENQNPAEHPDRFSYWRQVLCSQGLAGSPYYWEVDWTGQKITIGVAYKDLDRKSSDEQSRLGRNASSWCLYWSGTGFSFWHRGQETLLGSPKARRVGVYLDQHAGVLAFYRIHNGQAQLIHRYEKPFDGPLYPGFRFWTAVGSTVTICKLD